MYDISSRQSFSETPTSPSPDDEVTFITGVDASGKIAATSFWTWNGNNPATYSTTSTPTTSAGKWGTATAGTSGGTIAVYFDPSAGYSVADQAAVMACYALWSAVANITFVQTTDAHAAQITMGSSTHSGGSFTSYGGSVASSAGVIGSSTIPTYEVGSVRLDSGESLALPGCWGTVLHEIGHALGLGHSGPYNGTCDSFAQQYSAYDNEAWTIMSYILDTAPAKYASQYTVTGCTSGPSTWAIGDILAIQRLYGAATSSPLSGGQVFGFNCNITGPIRQFFDFATNPFPFVSLWDLGTNNTLDLSGFGNTQTINLNAGQFSSIAGQTNNLSIAFGTAIDTCIGGSGNDTITANNNGNLLQGGTGNDTLIGGTGTDTASYTDATSGVSIDLGLTTAQSVGGGLGTDTLTSIESLLGSSYDDTLIGNASNNLLNGGTGSDTVSYQTATGGVTVSLAVAGSQSVGGGQGSDTLVLIENLIGSAYDDTLTGDSGNNILEGAAGNDVLDGGSGSDSASYAHAASAVTVSLANAGAQAVGGGQGSDTLVSVENLIGSSYNDTLTGNAADNTLEGGAGNDALDGGAGSDTASYGHATSGVTVSLATTSAQSVGGGMGSDTLANIENLLGSTYNDTLAGNASDNILDGAAGNDTVTYKNATSGVTVDLSNTSAQAVGGGQGADTFVSIENLIGSTYNDTLRGNASDNVLDGGAGNDMLDGGAGSDTASYASATGGVAVSLALSSAQSVGGGMGADTLVSIENLTGSAYADTLTGNAGNNVLDGGAGNDVLDGGAGSDTVSYALATGAVTADLGLASAQTVGGGMGTDTLANIENIIGSSYGDTLTGTSATQSILGGAGDDTLVINGTLSGSPRIDGGAGTDTLRFNGDYSAGLTLTGGVIQDVETISFAASHVYKMTSDDNLVATGQRITVDATALGASDSVSFDGVAETDGTFLFKGGAGQNTLIGGTGTDMFVMGGNLKATDVLVGGTGSNLQTEGDGLQLQGDYSAGLTLAATTLTGIENLNLLSGYNYKITTNDANFTRPINASATWCCARISLSEGDGHSVYFDLSQETDAAVQFLISSGTNTIIGGAAETDYLVTGGINTIKGSSTGDLFMFGNGFSHGTFFNTADQVDGGAGSDLLYLAGDYATVPLVLGPTSIINVERIMMFAGYNYDLTTNEATVAAGQQVQFDASDLLAADSLRFNGSAEHDGSLRITGGRGNDTIAGGAGNDVINGGGGTDTVDYSHDAAGVTASLLTGTATGPASGVDTLINIENLTGGAGADTLVGDSNANVLSGGDEHDTLTGGAGNDTLDGGSNIDTAVFSGNAAGYTISQGANGVFTISGSDGTDTLSNVEYAKFDDKTVRLLPGTGTSIDWNADPSIYMAGIRDFDGNDVGAAAGWKLIGTADVNGDGTVEHILVNRQNGRWAEVGTEADGKNYLSNYGWAGDTRVVGIYIDPLVASGEVVAGGDFDSQRRFQNDLNIENIHGVLGQADYNHDGLQEIYFSLTDGTAYLHAYMHADGNIQYANYQNEQQVKDYLTSNGFTSTAWAGWFPAAQTPLAVVAGG